MKAAIIVFSPSDNSKKLSVMIQNELEEQGVEVQLIDVTGNVEFFNYDDIQNYISKKVKKHDVLLIGGPVYALHLQYHVQNLIKALPTPDNIWGKYAIPFVTYGGINSGIALSEAGKLLKKSGRIVYAGMKISAPHNMTGAFLGKVFNKDSLKDEKLIQVTELVNRILDLKFQTEAKHNIKSLNYNNFKIKIKANILKEEFWHKKVYPGIKIDDNACSGCGKCIKICPVLHLMRDGKKIAENNKSKCIHCFNCVMKCPANAIKLIGDIEKGKEFMQKKIEEEGNLEKPETAVYPLING